MDSIINIDEQMNQFRIASRELFNNFFRINDPYRRDRKQQAYLNEERFCELQVLLFQKLVAEPLSINVAEYGRLQKNIRVVSRHSDEIPIIINRDMDVESGYWDYPLDRLNEGSYLLFSSFFDWDQLDYRDNRYVCARVDHSPAHPDIVGRYGLIECHYVKFVLSKLTCPPEQEGHKLGKV